MCSRLAPLVLVASLITGCVIRSGPSPATFAPANSAPGIAVSLSTRGGPVRGELLDVRDDGLLVLAELMSPALERPTIALVPWEVISSATFRDYPVTWVAYQAPLAEVRVRLEGVSRYSPGLSDDQIQRLLDFHGQESVRRVSLHEDSPSSDPALTSSAFLDDVRGGSRRFERVDEAVLSGYRPIGPEFPGMGTHWVNTFVLMREGLDPARPPVLVYIDTPEGPALAGVAFAQILLDHEQAPDLPFPGAWHRHGGTLDEESLALNLDTMRHPAEGEPALAMMHVWTHLENPEGPFAQNNWAIPFVRAGVPAPDHPSAPSARAMFLASGGQGYYLEVIRALAPLTTSESAAVAETLRLHGERAAALLRTEGTEGLAAVWSSLGASIRARVEPVNWDAIASLGW